MHLPSLHKSFSPLSTAPPSSLHSHYILTITVTNSQMAMWNLLKNTTGSNKITLNNSIIFILKVPPSNFTGWWPQMAAGRWMQRALELCSRMSINSSVWQNCFVIQTHWWFCDWPIIEASLSYIWEKLKVHASPTRRISKIYYSW